MKVLQERCHCCDKPAAVIFNVGRETLVLTCDRCLEPCCRYHAVEEEGLVTCTLCLQTLAAQP